MPSPLEALALRLADLPHLCMNPACTSEVEDDADCCSSACSQAFAAWSVEMAEFYDDDHASDWREWR